MTTTTELSDAKRLLLQKLLRGEGARHGAGTDTVTPRAAGTVPPISPEQEHVWLHSSMAPHLPLYNEPITIHRKGMFDLAVMEDSFNELLCRHEIWRTSFEMVDGEVVQVVHPNLRVRLALVDLSALPEPAREAEALRIATEAAREPFDLSKTPLFRAKVLKLAGDDHRLYLTLHHIIFDGVSIYRILMPELAAIYEALSSRRRPTLPRPALQYADYAAWRKRRPAGDAIARQIDYWRRELAGELPVLQLPFDHPRPSRLTYRGSMETFTLSAELLAALKQLSQSAGVTLYMTLLAVFTTLLHRYTSQNDILVGGVTDTRRRPELQHVMGYFLNTVVLRTRPSAEMGFREYLVRVRDTVLGALGASDVPFDRVVRELQPKRDLSSHPLFQILFSIEPPLTDFTDDWNLTQMDVTIGAAKFDLYLELDERPDGMIGRFLYSTDVFDAATIRRMIGHWNMLLEGVAANPGCTLARLPLLTSVESRQLLEWNDTAQEFPQATLHEWFEAQARRTPGAVAVEFEGSSWSYEDLDRRAELLAVRLRRAGVEKEKLVAICVERSLELVACLLAILKAGGAYLPLDPALPRRRLALILNDARPPVLLTQRSLMATLPESGARVVLCDECSDDGDGAFPKVVSGVGVENLAYVLYTSGSTGMPKSVEVPHRAVVNLLTSMRRDPGFAAADTLLAVTTLSFDIAALELFLPLVTGGRVIVASQDTATDPLRLGELIVRSGCTVMQATPATWRALIEVGWAGSDGLKILCGGEALPRDLADELLTRCASLWNLYGPTEATIWSTVHRVGRERRPVPIGRPVANTTTYILDANSNLVPVGVPGDLYIGGAGVARGYRNRRKLTRQRFVMSAAPPGERLYNTGDLARYRSDGAIEWLGRTDHQVKIRGFRVGVEEIEAALASHSGIASAVVKAWPDASGEKMLTAYVTPRNEQAPTAAELRQFLRQTLPDYMVPSRYVLLPTLPMMPNGKVDRSALPEPEPCTPQGKLVEPMGRLEQTLAGIWKEVLGIPKIGLHDNFFDLGGHSLLVAKLVQRIEAEFGQRIPLAAVFHAPCLEPMAMLLRDKSSATKLPRTFEIQPKGWHPPLFWINGGARFRPLAEAIGLDQPFLGVALDPTEVDEVTHSSQLADIAPYLVRVIRAVQPDGPYYIGGWCTAGILAFEVASQLMADGREVALLILVHAPNPVHFRKMGMFAIEISKLKHHLAKAFHLRGRRRWSYPVEHAQDALQRIAQRFWRPTIASHQPEFSNILEQAALNYEPKPYAGDVVLFQPAERPDLLDYRPGWAEVVTGEFSAFDLSGAHGTMLQQPNVQQLAARVSACLSRARTVAQHWRKAAG